MKANGKQKRLPNITDVPPGIRNVVVCIPLERRRTTAPIVYLTRKSKLRACECLCPGIAGRVFRSKVKVVNDEGGQQCDGIEPENKNTTVNPDCL